MSFFVHTVIPHNHIHDDFAGCKQLLHHSVSCTSEEGIPYNAGKEHTDENVCHLSNFLFHSLNTDFFLVCSTKSVNIIPDSPGTDICISNENLFISELLKGTSFLRAPPLS